MSEFNFLKFPYSKEPLWIPVPKRIRAKSGNQFIVDSTRAMMMRGMPPVYYFQARDVKVNQLRESEYVEEDKRFGRKKFWHLISDEKHVENAAWSYVEPEIFPEIENYVAFKWNAMDSWWEEDEQVRVHPRDPYSRIDVIQSSRHVKVGVEGETIAESKRPMLVFETGLPTRYYFYKTDIKMDSLEPTPHLTECPYKGEAHYYSIKGKIKTYENIAWTYPFPQQNLLKIKDMITFFQEQIEDFYVDGQKIAKVKTKWSR